MAPLELRYELYKALARLGRPAAIEDVTMVSPVPGEPVKLAVRTLDPMGEPRNYTISIVED